MDRTTILQGTIAVARLDAFLHAAIALAGIDAEEFAA
jgi:hypothetical protein